MYKLITTTLLFLTFSPSWAEQKASFPEEVRKFMEKRDLCDHFRGEPAYDEERRKFLVKNMKELCTGTDQRLKELKEKYKSNNSIVKALSYYEEDIEP